MANYAVTAIVFLIIGWACGEAWPWKPILIAGTNGIARDPAIKREEIIICESCRYSTDIYNWPRGICDRCLKARKYWLSGGA